MMLTSSGPAPQVAGTMPTNFDLTLLEDVSRQMASSNLSRRHSKGSRIGGGSMRISKANSTNNSPRNSTTLNRRRTVMGDSYRRQPSAVNQGMAAPGEPSQAYLTPLQAVSQTRPLSWHPSAYSQYDVPFQPVYNPSMPDYSMSYSNNQDLPHTPALQSNYGSPSAAFSPESQPWTNYDQEYPLYDTTSLMHPTFDNGMADYYSQYQLQLAAQTEQTYNDCMNPSIYSHFDWNNFAATGFEDGTAPPTPENFLPIQHPEPPCVIETAIPYHSLDDEEDEGEILVGMGLYDTPDKPSLPDVQLEQYRTVMRSQYLGSAHRATESSTGKGLKLEETWNPPAASEDGEDEDQDAEGSDDEEEQQSKQQGQAPVVNGNVPAVAQYQGEGWL